MQIELDHLFVCSAPGAPEAEKLVQFGLHEGPPNEYPGQGTACGRFSFANAMIELFWVSDASEAQSQSTRRTLLWERWSGRQGDASPFGICVRPVHPQDTGSPFLAWDYRPAYLPEPLSMQIGEAGIEEPMWIHLSFMRRAQREGWFTEHPIGIREITRLTLTTPMPVLRKKSKISTQLRCHNVTSVQDPARTDFCGPQWINKPAPEPLPVGGAQETAAIDSGKAKCA